MKRLFANNGFPAFIGVLFLNAFVDLGHKIIVQNTLFKTLEGSAQIALTALVNALILLPFVLVFTPAGFLSDRFTKPPAKWIFVPPGNSRFVNDAYGP